MRRKKEKQPEINLLALIPERLIAYETGKDDFVTLLAPRFKANWLRRLFEPRLKHPLLKVKLDEIGSTVWLHIDGTRTVGTIANVLREKFAERIEPCHERLGLFLAQMEHAHYICYTNIDACRQAATEQAHRPDRESHSPERRG
jgi:hypothetical protein